MLNILYSEIIKLKNTRILWLIPVGAFIPVLLLFINALNDKDYQAQGWPYFLGHVLLSMSELAPPVFILFTGYIFAREYQDNTISCVFTYPIMRTGVLISKTVLLIPIIVAITFLAFISALCLGVFLVQGSLSWDVFVMYVRTFILMVIVHFALIPAAVTISIVSKNIVASTVAAIASFLLFVALSGTKYNVFYPWCIPALFATKWGQYEKFWEMNTIYACITLSIIFIIPLIFNIFYYNKLNITA